MPNTGKPSPNCHLCRSRRVKCDLGRPSCQRCIKYGAQCPGYRDQQDLMFRNASPSTLTKRKKRRADQTHPAKAQADTFSPPESTHDRIREADMVIRSPGPGTSNDLEHHHLAQPRNLTEHWTAHSIPIVLEVYSTLGFLDDMCSNYPDDGPLVWAAHLFSRTYVINLRYPTAVRNESVLESQRELANYMGKTIRAVHNALKSPEGVFRDDILATVWILANYELLVGSIRGRKSWSPWHLHTRGLYSIIKARGIQNLRSDCGRAAFWSAFSLVQIDSMLCYTPGPPEAKEWLTAIREGMYEVERRPLAVAVFMDKAAGIQSRLCGVVHRNDQKTAPSEYLGLIGELASAENEAETSLAAVPSTGDPFEAYWRSNYYTCLLSCYHLAQALINVLTHHDSCPIPLDRLKEQRDYCVQRIHGTANGILSHASRVLDTKTLRNDKSPKALFDALKIVWPLTTVHFLPSVLSVEQKSQAGMSLYFIGRELGIKQALHLSRETSAGRFPQEALAPVWNL